MGFIIHSQRFTEPNYPDVDISFGLFCMVPETKSFFKCRVKSALLQKVWKNFWAILHGILFYKLISGEGLRKPPHFLK